MWSTYEPRLLSSWGRLVGVIDDWQNIEAARAVNAVGALVLKVPYTDDIWVACQPDAILDLWRRGLKGKRQRVMDTIWLLRKKKKVLTATGDITLELTFVDTLDILRRWMVKAEQGDASADFTKLGEAAMKFVVTNELVTRGALPITVEDNNGYGKSVTVACANQNVLSVCQAVAQASAQDGAYLAFDLVPLTGPTELAFRVYPNTRGIDRSALNGRALIMSAEAGNIGAGDYTADYTTAVSYIRVGGQLTSGHQVFEDATNTALEYLGPFSHVEAYGSAPNTISAATLQTAADQTLRNMRPYGDVNLNPIVETENCLWGQQFDFGDMVRVQFGSVLETVRLESFKVTVDAASGLETISATARAELT